MGMTRRKFLQVSAAGAAVLALGGAGLALQATVMRTPRAPLRSLSDRGYSVLASLADRVCPPGGAFPSASDVGVAEKVDALLATMHPGTVAEVEQALLLFENGLAHALFDGTWRTFTASPAEVQDAILASWQTSRLSLRRQVYKALRGLVAASYFGSPEVYAAVGYPGPPDFSGASVAVPAPPGEVR